MSNLNLSDTLIAYSHIPGNCPENGSPGGILSRVLIVLKLVFVSSANSEGVLVPCLIDVNSFVP